MTDYISFDDALGELNLRSAELKRLMSEGQIRGERGEEGVRFRLDEFERFRKQMGAESPEELLFVDEDDVEDGMATAQISEEDTLLEEEPEEIEDEIDLSETPSRSASSRRTPRARSSSGISSVRNRALAAEAEQAETGLDRVFLIVGSAIMLYGVIALLAAAIGQSDGLTSFLANIF